MLKSELTVINEPMESVVFDVIDKFVLCFKGKRNKFKEAEPICKRALELREKYLGPYHPDVGKQLNNLALLCYNQGKYDDVESYYKRSIDIYTKSLGPDDPNTIKARSHLASVYLKQRKYKEAEQLYKEILTQALDKESSSIISDQSNLSANSNYDAQGGWYKTMRVDSPTITSTLKNLSILYRKQGRNEGADLLENYSSRARKEPQVIVQALNLIKKSSS